MKLFGSKLFSGAVGEGREVEIEGLSSPGIIHKDGLLLTGTDGKKVNLGLFYRKSSYSTDGRCAVIFKCIIANCSYLFLHY